MDQSAGRKSNREINKAPSTVHRQEVATAKSTQLARTTPVYKHIAHYRSINELDFRQTLWTGMPLGFAFALIQSGSLAIGLMSIPLFVISVVSGFKLFRNLPKGIQAQNTEFKSGDYTALQIWAPFLPMMGTLAAIPLDFFNISGLQTPELIKGMLGSVLFGASISFGLWGLFTQAFRIGKRRIKKITEKQSLDGVSESRMEAIESNGDIFGGLIAAGAVDGNEISVKTLGKLLNWDKEDIASLQSRINELGNQGLVKISGQGLYQQAKFWQVTVTPDGIRNIAQIGKR